jgi:NADH:ubiquinone oxidoreductase subunit 6 (subunit J)
MNLQKIKRIVGIILGLNFILIALSVFFMEFKIFPLSIRQIHVIFGAILLFLATIHIILQHFLKKPKH